MWHQPLILKGLVVNTLCGAALTVVMNVGSSDLIKTMLLAAIGAVVSFSVSWLLKQLAEKFKK